VVLLKDQEFFMTVTQEEIAARKAYSKKKYEALKAKQAKMKADRKARRAAAVAKRRLQKTQIEQGLAWERYNSIQFSCSKLEEFMVTSGYIVLKATKKHVSIKAAYSIKAPEDKDIKTIGEGLVAYRLMTPNSQMCFSFELPMFLLVDPQIPLEVLSLEIKKRIFLDNPDIPEKVKGKLLKPAKEAYQKLLKKPTKSS
jgi:hypothetical protein